MGPRDRFGRLQNTGRRWARDGGVFHRGTAGSCDLGAGEMLCGWIGGQESFGEDEDRGEEGLVVDHCVGADGGGGQ